MIGKAADARATLIVLPELCDTGYVFNSRTEALALCAAVTQSPAVAAWCDIAHARGLHIVAGFGERDGDTLYNSAAVIGPEGLLGVYRKTHLWGAENTIFAPGNLGYPVFATPFGNVAALICYDGWFPEAWRLCALQGADIVCVPTNWVPMPSQPDGMMSMSNILCMANAHANAVFVAAACRIGTERGQPFIGQSLIVDPAGWPIAGPAGKADAAMLIARVDLADARKARRLNDFNET